MTQIGAGIGPSIGPSIGSDQTDWLTTESDFESRDTYLHIHTHTCKRKPSEAEGVTKVAHLSHLAHGGRLSTVHSMTMRISMSMVSTVTCGAKRYVVRVFARRVYAI